MPAECIGAMAGFRTFADALDTSAAIRRARHCHPGIRQCDNHQHPVVGTGEIEIELEDGSGEDRAKLMEVFPPLESDGDDGSMIGE